MLALILPNVFPAKITDKELCNMETLASIINKKIKPILADTLGIALATLVILQNSKKLGIIVANINKDGYIKLINAITSDKRVTSNFNVKEIKAKKEKWLKLIN